VSKQLERAPLSRSIDLLTSVGGSGSAYMESYRSLSTSTVVITYNSAQDIDSCLSAIADGNSAILPEIMVVDNASIDDTRAIVARYPTAYLVRNDRNEGFAAAVNRGIGLTSENYILILNPDVVVTANAVSALIDALEMNEEYAAIGCRMIFPDGRSQLSARSFPTIASFLKRALSTNNMTKKFHKLAQRGDREPVEPHGSSELRPVDWILGGCMMIRRSAFADIGPLDEKYFLYYEDIDWCFRAHLQGWKIGFLPTACVIHDYKRSSSKLSFTNPLTLIHFRSVLRFFLKFASIRGLKSFC
jgi:N-acetylglucosaminyl-diphospho-decaprenol L-rhamnosyltransferase